MGADDFLATAQWDVMSTAPGEFDGPRSLPSADDPRWLAAPVPGTAAAAVVLADGPRALDQDFDGRDWWWRCRMPGEAGESVLGLEGLATLADVWVDDVHVLHSEDMFLAHEVDIAVPSDGALLTIRCSALGDWLARRRPRPRWKCRDLTHPGLRWLRTSLLGRTTGGVAAPAPVGPWRPVTLHGRDIPHVTARSLSVMTDLERRRGSVSVDVLVRAAEGTGPWSVRVGGTTVTADTVPEGACLRLTARVDLADIELWWPATHGAQSLYPVVLVAGNTTIPLGRVGFRTMTVDRQGGAFTFSVNGVPIFVRGATWTPPDPTHPHSPRDLLEARLRQWRAANLNLVRVAGIGVYESTDFADLCDELGLLVWQDAMFAYYDIPDDVDYRALVGTELRQELGRWQGRPSLAVVCGASENEQQAAYLGLEPGSWRAAVTEYDLPAALEELVPGTPYVRTTPDAEPLPSRADNGPAHYFGVGGYLRPLEDARRAGVRFASECLPFATPPEPTEHPDHARILAGPGHTPEWKRAVHRDSGTAWDLEDVRDHYTREFFALEPSEVRRYDTERALDLARATAATAFEATLGEWRRPGSSCRGAVVLQGHDARFGAGLGLVDSLGRPKSSWFVMRRLSAPVVVLLTDEGVNGLGLHVANDALDDFEGEVRLDLVTEGRFVAESRTIPVRAPAGGGVSLDTGLAFGGFRDLSWAHRFGPPAFDVVAATLLDGEGRIVGRAHHVPVPVRTRSPQRDLGLQASLHADGEGTWRLRLTTEQFAFWVAVDAPGATVEDSWFHLLPEENRDIVVLSAAPGTAPRVGVRALNGATQVRATLS